MFESHISNESIAFISSSYRFPSLES